MKFWSILKKILFHQEPIAGLEISDGRIRLVLLSFDKKTNSLIAQEYAEQPLEFGVIVDGAITDPQKLYLALAKLKNKLKTQIDYVIATVPSDSVYTKILSFPKNIESAKLDEAIKLAFDFQLPLKTKDSYCSWENFSEKTSQKIFTAEALKKDINPYVECIRRVFHLVALEFHAVSFSRVAPIKNDSLVLLQLLNQTSLGFFAIKNKAILFSRTVKSSYPEEKIGKEPEKIINFCESLTKEKITEIIDLSENAPPANKKIVWGEISINNSWLIVLGAALRGTIPRHQDNFISLLPISAQKSYKYQKAVSFSSIISKITIGLSIFFIISFSGVLLLMITLQQHSTRQSDSLNNLPLAPEINEIEQKIKTTNNLVYTTAQILKNSPQWSIIINELQGLSIGGIIISGVSLPGAEQILYINGVAKNRLVLNEFRDKLKSSPQLNEVILPLTNLEKKEDIPFSISFKIKNPQLIYFQ